MHRFVRSPAAISGIKTGHRSRVKVILAATKSLIINYQSQLKNRHAFIAQLSQLDVTMGTISKSTTAPPQNRNANAVEN